MNGIVGFIVIALVLFTLTIITLRGGNKDWQNTIKENPMLIMIFIIPAMLTLLFSLLLAETYPYDYDGEPSSKIEIASLELVQETSGMFVLGSGGADEDVVYYFYQVLPDGGYKLDSISAESTVIKEFDRVSNLVPSVERYDRVMWQRLLIPAFGQDDGAKYIIYIPRGSIIQQYNPNVR